MERFAKKSRSRPGKVFASIEISGVTKKGGRGDRPFYARLLKKFASHHFPQREKGARAISDNRF